MNNIGRMMPFGFIMRFWLLAVVSAAILTSAVACSEDPDPTSTPVPEPTATSAPPQPAATTAPPAATTAPPTATPEPEVEVIDAEPLNIVATSNIVGDWIEIVGGDRVDVLSLVPRGADPHAYQPGARDIARVADSDLVFAVGLQLEHLWLEELIHNAATDHDSVFELAEHVNAIPFVDVHGHGHGDEDHDDHAHDEDEHAHDEDEHAHEHDEDEHMEHDDHGHGELTGRLLIGDADSGHIIVLDLMTEEISELDIHLPGPVSALYASPNHRFGYAIYRGDEGDHAVHTIDGGVYLVPHGDHEDLVVVPASEVGLTVNEELPIHFTNGGEWSAIFHDATGLVALMNEHEIEEEGHDYEIPYLNAGPQHGAAVPLENDLFAVTVANPDPSDVLPIGVEVRNLQDEVVWDGSREACPGMHGEAHNHHGSAYGCNGGVLFIEPHDDHFDYWLIENGEDMPEGGRVGSVWGHHDAEHFFGYAVVVGPQGFANAGVWMIDPEGQEMVQVLPPSDDKNVVTGVFGHDGSVVYVLTYDGVLNAIDAANGEVIGEAQLTDPVDAAGGDAVPSLIIVGETLFMTESAHGHGHVIAFDLDHMHVAEEWELDISPTSLAFVGIVAGDEHPEHGHDEHDDEHMEHKEGVELKGRLIVGDADSEHLFIVDLMEEEISELDVGLPGPVSALYASPSHRFGYAIYRGDEGDHAVHTIDGGVFLVPHGDHEDLVVVPASEVGLTVNEELPIHFTNGGEWSAIFHDATGLVALMNEHEIAEEGQDYEIPYLNAGPQHGAAVPLGNDLFAVTVANPDPSDVLPIGVEIRNLDDEVVWDGSREACPGMHGEAHNHHGSAYGCNDGVLFIEPHDDHFDYWLIENGEGMPEGGRVGAVWGHHDAEHFFGYAVVVGPQGFANAGVWMIDPEGQEMVQVLPPSDDKNVVTGVFGHDGSVVYVHTYDGVLNAIDAHDGDVIGEAQLTDPVDAAGGDAVPSLIIVGETLFMTESAHGHGHVIAFDLDHMEVVEEWEVDGSPTSLAFLGIVEDDHAHEDHAHEDEDDHAHEDHDDHAHEDEHGHEGHIHGAFDPHFWFDPERVIVAIEEIAEQLSALEPASEDYFNANADDYIAKLEELDHWIEDTVATVDEHDRILVTSHDAFGYFAARYGFTVAGVIIPGGGTELEPSPQELAELVHQVEDSGATVVFSEVQISDRLARTLADEAGIRLVGGLHAGTLGGDGSGAENYLDFMRTNVGIIVGALSE